VRGGIANHLVPDVAIRAAILGTFFCFATPIHAGDAGQQAADNLTEVVVGAKRLPEPDSDEALTQRVEKTLLSDPFFYGEHLTVTTTHGVVHLEGSVYEDVDLFRVLRAARRVPGVKRVVNELDMDGAGGS